MGIQADINSRIAFLRNDGASYREIADKICDEFGENLTSDAVKKRTYRMRNTGAMDFTNEKEIDILDEIEREAGGLFKIGVLDIETTGLWADFGYVLVAVIKDLESNKYEVFRLDECKSYHDPQLRCRADFWRRVDKELLQQIRNSYEDYDIIVHFNGRNFDIKFLNTRMLKNGIPLLPEMKQLDIYQIAKHRIRLRSKRLDALKDFLEVDKDAEGHKWEYWQMAGAGVKEGFDYVVEHCTRDVDRLAEVARRMKQYINFIRK
jgi:DNA polymerase elongation subunit (family B)